MITAPSSQPLSAMIHTLPITPAAAHRRQERDSIR
jgi:hypothetical protein